MRGYHYTECGLDNIYLLNGYEEIKHSDGTEAIYIQDIHDLHNAIALFILTKSGSLSGEEIKFIRHSMDLSQKRLAKLLGVDYQTVLRWEKNRIPIQKTADHLLKALFLAYINKEESKAIYEKINEISDLDSKEIEEKRKEMEFIFDKQSLDWKIAVWILET